MKRTIKHKNLISLIVVLILLVSITVSSYAIWNPFDYQRNRAFIAAALTALNIAFESQQMSALSVVDYIADPLELNYSYVDMWEDRPQIQIWDDYVEIDGQSYTDIWISNEAAEKFRVDAYDFRTAYNIASQDNGIFASGTGTYGGLPVYNINGVQQTQNYVYPATNGSPFGTAGTVDVSEDTFYIYSGYTPTQSSRQSLISMNKNFGSLPIKYRAYLNNGTWRVGAKATGYNQEYSTSSGNSYFVQQPFDFEWVAQDIPADEPLPSDTGMMIRVPSNDPLGNPYFDDFLTDNPEFKDNPVTIDVNLDPDIKNKLDDLINIIAPIIPQINNNKGDVNFTINHTQPAPVIDNLLPDTYKQEIMQPIYENFQQTQETITQMGDTIVENIPNINDICNNIDTAPYHDLDTGLDHLPTVFLPFITDLRSALGIWHYVTEWISQISTTFAFVTGCLVGTSIMTPIYAAIAGFMCIKVYRRMTG